MASIALNAVGEDIETRSPGGSIAIRVIAADELNIQVIHDDAKVLEFSKFNVETEGAGKLSGAARIESSTREDIDREFELTWGKTREVRQRGRHTWIELVNEEGITWVLECAAYDDGVAFRYGVAEQDNVGEITVRSENADVCFGGVPTIHYTVLQNFTTDHEAEFHRDELPGVMGPLVDLPMVADWPDAGALGFTEARVKDYPHLYLKASPNLDSELFHTALSPLPGRDDACAVVKAPFMSPWRVILLGDDAGSLIESNLVVSLNDPPSGDFAWADPGKSTWHWWNGTFDQGPDRVPGMNLETHKQYIDFCAENDIKFHAVVADTRPWHVQTSHTFGPGPDTDITKPRSELQLPEILAYAKERGVGIRLWVHWKALDPRMEEAFQKYEDWGVKGLMIDFLNRDDQEMVDFCYRVLESAARHKLHIQFHGSFKPSGEERTYPNLYNREGVLNLEYLKWSKRCTPPHNVEAAYVRQLAGPMDYHSGGFRSIANSDFVARNENPYVLGTRCHHLAMFVVYENPMPMVCDTPEAYEDEPGFDFIVDVPTTWDETRFVMGDTGDYIVMARRKGSSWYVGGMNDWTQRTIEAPLDFLPRGRHDAKIYSDGSLDQNEPNAIDVRTAHVTAKNTIVVPMAPGGGFAAIVSRN